MHHKLDGYQHEPIAACNFTHVLFVFFTSFLEFLLFFFTIHWSPTPILPVQTVHLVACSYCHHNHHQSNNSMQFIFISVPTLQPDGLNMETRIKRTINGTNL